MDISFILTIVLIVAALYCLVKLISAPLKFIFKFILNMASGFLILLVTEVVLGFFDMSVGITLFNSLVAGICGIPGVIVLLILKLLF